MPLIAGFGMLIHTKSRRTDLINQQRLSTLHISYLSDGMFAKIV